MKRRAGAVLLAVGLLTPLPMTAIAQETSAPATSLFPKAKPDRAPTIAPAAEAAPAQPTATSVPNTSPQTLTGLARLTGAGVTIKDRWRGTAIDISMTRTVPWRVFTLDDPQRVVVDFSELDWAGLDLQGLIAASDRITDIRAGLFRPGWTRLVLTLSSPMVVEKAWMTGASANDDTATMHLELAQSSLAEFAATIGAPDSAVFAQSAPRPMPSPKTRQTGFGDLVVVLDPGHGGIDPGAERDGVVEADLMLTFALQLKETLLRAGGFKVVLTRERDVFVPLEERVTIARRAGADVFLSLHADALAQGRATGATVYTLSDEATDAASQTLAERHDREDILAGVDLTRQSDEVALVLMDLARTETTPRSEALADTLVEGIHSATQSTYKSPRMKAGFSVLKAPDIPSALIELGFLSSPRDRKLLQDENWRKKAAEGIRDALQYWSLQDAAKAERLRQ
ncbi:N-acetylmuramoyl-L-alanine amidase [Aliiroseovarius sp. S1339]|uniref:N-acetylmuramoyl-L-alanine amidase n=1 Tax=Aliiroseovarius sp. S1339 TaxID=2936990 RepID=UPI0020BE6424|nr:N-acetylmuramoyl-L-alanine amidase [Aliiroseovarius sp. S1339]MCK8462526.1 N-acetylmuramoyl-L-alanine amidase [Aliiroseovarius sp. S1339]